jgi:protein-L-isoaspartate(D-aspartate) O-methyltransferase
VRIAKFPTAIMFAVFAIANITSTVQAEERVTARAALAEQVSSRFIKAGLRQNRYVRAAIGAVRVTPRHLFVPPTAQAYAYQGRPLPIGFDQTISDPFIVALMTSLLHVRTGRRILEVGTGSGYQAAILNQLGADVFSIEIVAPLAEAAALRLKDLGYSRVQVRTGDGYAGWPEHAPFDGIIVTAGATHIPPAMLTQLKPGGRMVIPLGPNWAQEELMLVIKRKDGRLKYQSYGPVFFVDFTGKMKGAGSHPNASPSQRAAGRSALRAISSPSGDAGRWLCLSCL